MIDHQLSAQGECRTLKEGIRAECIFQLLGQFLREESLKDLPKSFVVRIPSEKGSPRD
jgi:hypothetical protein